jgi:hypothetical protein
MDMNQMLNLDRRNLYLTRIVRDIDMHIQGIFSEQHKYRKPRLDCSFFFFYCR